MTLRFVSFSVIITLHLTIGCPSTTGIPFVSNPVQLELQPNSSELVTMSGKAIAAGTLIVRGCFMQLPGVEVHETLLPVLSEEEEERRFMRIVAELNEADRTKFPNLSDRLNKKRESADGKQSRNSASTKHLTLKIVPEQPNMSIRRTSLTNGAVMLYEGET